VHNDLTFFTNEPGATLLDRFNKTLKHVQFFDVLVGYFRTSGFYNLYEALEGVEKIRILVGLNIDRQTYEMLQPEHWSGCKNAWMRWSTGFMILNCENKYQEACTPSIFPTPV